MLSKEDVMRNRRGPVVVAGLGLVALLMAPEIAWTQEAAIRKLVGEDYDKAEKAGDVSAKMRLYTADAVLLPPKGPAVSGQQAIRVWHEAIFKKETSQILSKVDEIQTFGEWGFARGTSSGTVTSKAGGQRRKSTEKWLVLVRRQADGSWKIARDIWHEEPQPAESN
jgi:uncharacterized protein (TIGR02246 family)